MRITRAECGVTMDNTPLRLLARLRDEQVETMIVGGQAVRLNGYLRTTREVDLLIRQTRVNVQSVLLNPC